MNVDVEVYEVEPGKPRNMKDCIDMLASGGPVPAIGDTLLLSVPDKSGALFGGDIGAFRVVDREYLYTRADAKSVAVPFGKVWIHVRRLTLAEYQKTPGV